jgi:hypothetical protein
MCLSNFSPALNLVKPGRTALLVRRRNRERLRIASDKKQRPSAGRRKVKRSTSNSQKEAAEGV